MKMFPAIDLYGGKAVRLYKGDYAQMTVYSDDPVSVARDFVCALLSEFSRLSVGKIGEGIREVKETAILIKSLFCVSEFFGRSLVLPWFILGL